MSLRRRLLSLECRPFRRPIEKPRFSELDERIRKKLALPLPEDANDAERAEGLRLMKAAQQLPIDDHSGWQAVRGYALSLHQKYGSIPFHGWPD
jgi:hypothetical protein